MITREELCGGRLLPQQGISLVLPKRQRKVDASRCCRQRESLLVLAIGEDALVVIAGRGRGIFDDPTLLFGRLDRPADTGDGADGKICASTEPCPDVVVDDAWELDLGWRSSLG